MNDVAVWAEPYTLNCDSGRRKKNPHPLSPGELREIVLKVNLSFKFAFRETLVGAQMPGPGNKHDR